MTERKKDKTNRLLALSSAAVLTVYGAGYMRTKAAADRFSDDPPVPLRRPVAPVPVGGANAAPPPALAPMAAAAQPAQPVVERIASKEPIPAVTPEPVRTAATSTTPVQTDVPARTKPAHDEKAAAPAPEMAAAPAPLVAMAPASTALPVAAGQVTQLSAAPPAPKWKDGTYSGWGTCRHGDIEATVTVAAGRITSARVSQCYTRYSCSWIDPIVPQVVARQSPETDYVSGATQSTYAFYYAVIEALSKAKP